MDMSSVLGVIVKNAPQFVGFILPPVVQYLNKDVKNEKERFMVTLLLCFVVSVILNWEKIFVETSWMSVDVLFSTLAFIFAQSQIVYKLYFKNSYLENKIEEKIKPEIKLDPVIPSRVPTEVKV